MVDLTRVYGSVVHGPARAKSRPGLEPPRNAKRLESRVATMPLLDVFLVSGQLGAKTHRNQCQDSGYL